MEARLPVPHAQCAPERGTPTLQNAEGYVVVTEHSISKPAYTSGADVSQKLDSIATITQPYIVKRLQGRTMKEKSANLDERC